MWEIYEHNHLGKKIPSLPHEILKRYEKWKDIVKISGPQGLRLIKGLHDEALKGDWKGFRSSRLGRQYRVIYQVMGEQILVRVVTITSHDYRRKGS